ncbi:Chromatin-remodeling ATPase INO80 [Labeo rohita]|uniref:Chromatin-remodeling ATPase INO80 n=1 Tax=Labeo rohita TaxID=84645 RepID=A0ABQ8MEX4_LABRO|nr:Chromatin-remodeling ATPase INO80 [Labeo rohita]
MSKVNYQNNVLPLVCPELSACHVMTTEFAPLFAMLLVLGVTIWCVWVTEGPEPLVYPELLPSLPLPPPLMWPLPFSPPQFNLCPPSVDPLSPPPASESWPPPRPIGPAAPPWLLALSSPPLPASPPALLGFLIPPALSCSVVDHLPPRDSTPLASPRHSVPLALSGSFFPPTPPWSSITLAPLRPSGSSPVPWSPEPSAPPWSSRASPSSPWAPLLPAPPLLVSPPGVVSPSSTMAPPSVGSTIGHLHDCSLGPAWLLLLPHVFSLAPPSVFAALAPPDSSMAPPSVISALVICLPLTTASSSSQTPSLSAFVYPALVRGCAFQEGEQERNMEGEILSVIEAELLVMEGFCGTLWSRKLS